MWEEFSVSRCYLCWSVVDKVKEPLGKPHKGSIFVNGLIVPGKESKYWSKAFLVIDKQLLEKLEKVSDDTVSSICVCDTCLEELIQARKAIVMVPNFHMR